LSFIEIGAGKKKQAEGSKIIVYDVLISSPMSVKFGIEDLTVTRPTS